MLCKFVQTIIINIFKSNVMKIINLLTFRSKSRVETFLKEIEDLQVSLQEKDEEIIRLKTHYRSLLSKMKRNLERSEARRETMDFHH